MEEKEQPSYIYKAERKNGNPVVFVIDGANKKRLPHIPIHSPVGLEWGFQGSGPADLSLSILAHHFGESKKQVIVYYNRPLGDEKTKSKAVEYHQEFKRRVIANWPRETGGQITTEEINTIIATILEKEVFD